MTAERDIDLLNLTADVHFKKVRYKPTCYLAYDTAQILQLWHCVTSGKTQWRPLPDLEEFCAQHGIGAECR